MANYQMNSKETSIPELINLLKAVKPILKTELATTMIKVRGIT